MKENCGKIIVIICLIGLVSLEPVPDLVKVRRREDAKGAEFVVLDMIGLVEQWGYPVEQHNFTTEDGYILTICRIPWSPYSSNNTGQKPVILVMSGLAGSSDIWMVGGINKSLPLQLADEGYDVWMGNFRGNTYGRAHVKLSPNDAKFWDHSMHELGAIDLPNSIDYILDFTKQYSLTYLGHSLGGTTMIILLSEHPEYNEKIDFIILFAPSSYWVEHTLFREAASLFGDFFQHSFDQNGTMEIFPQSSVLAGFFKRFCMPNGISNRCFGLLDSPLASDILELDEDKIIEYASYYPSGSAAKVFYHYAQGMLSNKFRQWDFEDTELNIQHYGQPEPPDYETKNVKVPMIIYYGKTDMIVHVNDIRYMITTISSKAIVEPIRSARFSHGDFVLSKNVKKLVNDQVIMRLKQFRAGKIPYLQTNESVY